MRRGEYLGQLLNDEVLPHDDAPPDAALVEKRWGSIFKTYSALRSPDLDGAPPETTLELMRTFETRMDQFAAWCGVELPQMHEWLDEAWA